MSLNSALNQLKNGADRVIETSCAIVVLKGHHAYKLKKNVDYGFLDFTSAEKRRAALWRELRYNQRMAADIYLGVEEIDAESVLVMRRFDTAAVLGEQDEDAAWTPDPGLMRDLGKLVARFHVGSEICTDANHAGNIRYVIESNRSHMAAFRVQLGAEAVEAYDTAIEAAYQKVADRVRQRFAQGHVRHCHGDLHLGNILIENGKPVLFDCIEFNERLSQIDVLYDLAFLLMDLWVRGHGAAASLVMNSWLEQAARLEDNAHALYAGLELLPLYMSMRAAVRCHVHANYGGEGRYGMDKARMYLAAAQRFLDMPPPGLTAIGGLSGSGKSTRARQMAPDLGRTPGAVILRSDEIRKRLWACPEYERLPREAYAPEQNSRVYRHMFDLATVALRAGQAVILDATFRESAWRQEAEALAGTCGVAFDGLWLEAPAGLREARVAARGRDVSDATPDIVRAQQAVDPLMLSWRVEDAAAS